MFTTEFKLLLKKRLLRRTFYWTFDNCQFLNFVNVVKIASWLLVSRHSTNSFFVKTDSNKSIEDLIELQHFFFLFFLFSFFFFSEYPDRMPIFNQKDFIDLTRNQKNEKNERVKNYNFTDFYFSQNHNCNVFFSILFTDIKQKKLDGW